MDAGESSNLDIESAWGERLVPRRLLRRILPVSDMTVWRWERDGLFPRHISINGRNYWRGSEIDAWIEEQSSRRKRPASEAPE